MWQRHIQDFEGGGLNIQVEGVGAYPLPPSNLKCGKYNYYGGYRNIIIYGREGAKDPPPPLNLPLHVSIFTASRVSSTGQPQTRIVSMVTSRAHAQQGGWFISPLNTFAVTDAIWQTFFYKKNSSFQS